jgi:hypothetical protein
MVDRGAATIGAVSKHRLLTDDRSKQVSVPARIERFRDRLDTANFFAAIPIPVYGVWELTSPSVPVAVHAVFMVAIVATLGIALLRLGAYVIERRHSRNVPELSHQSELAPSAHERP